MVANIRRQLTVEERNKFSMASDLVAHLLFHRGIKDQVSAERFMDPDYNSEIHDPFLLKDAEKAATRIIEAIKNKEKMAIYADYDADGIPGAAIFDDFLRRIGYTNYTVYIPHRHDEGFGLNDGAVEELAESGVKLLITIDCGITDISSIVHANRLGMEVIVTDHHEPPILADGATHPAFAVVDHRQNGCSYPDKNICGSGVIFKLIQAILKIDRLGLKEGMEKWLLDLVGIATLSDMVPLVGENRTFAYYGLRVLRKSPRKGLVALLRKLRMEQRSVTEDDVAFMVTPRINAASRMGVPMDAFRLLSANDESEAEVCADHLDTINSERKSAVAVLVREVKKMVKDRNVNGLPHVIVNGNPSWRPSLLGLAANSCAEEFDRPVFLWGRDGDNAIKGSCRSEGRTNVVELMRSAIPRSFSQFGGHKHSGGFAVSNEEIYFLEQRLNEAYLRLFGGTSNGVGNQDHLLDPDEVIDHELSVDLVDRQLFTDIDKLSPFGMGNPKPIFLFKEVTPINVRIFGKGSDHIELVFKKNNGVKVSAISFFGSTSDWSKKIKIGGKVNLVASVEKSVYGGREEIRLRIVDVSIC